MHDLVDDLGKARSRERPPAGGKFVQDDPHAEDVAAMVEILAQRLLGAHVAGRPEHLSRLRLLKIGGDVGPVRACRQPFGEPEVEHLDLSPLIQTDIGGLDVAMHNPPVMGGIQRVGDLDGDLDDLARFPAVLF